MLNYFLAIYICIIFISGKLFDIDSIFRLTKSQNLEENSVLQIQNSKKLLVHYFEGDCSSCIGQMSSIEKLFKEYETQSFALILISSSQDSVLVNYYADSLGLSSILLHDIEQRFYKENKLFFQTHGYTFLLNKNGRVLANGDILGDETIYHHYLEFLKE